MWHIKAHWVDIGSCPDVSYICTAPGLRDIRPSFVRNPIFTLINSYFSDIGLTVAATNNSYRLLTTNHRSVPRKSPPSRQSKLNKCASHPDLSRSFPRITTTYIRIKCAGTTAAGPQQALACIKIINISGPLEFDNLKSLTPLKGSH